MPSVFNIGHANDNTTGASFALTVGTTVPAGAVVFVGVRENAAISAVGTNVTDSKGNTYTMIASVLGNSAGNNSPCQLWYSTITTALGAADTITYTKRSNLDSATMAAGYATGCGALDSAVTATGHGSATTVVSFASGVPSVPGELFVAMASGGNNGTFTVTGAWTTPPLDAYNATPVVSNMGGGYQINSGTGALTFTATLGVAMGWGGVIAAFKSAPAVGLNMPMLGM